MLTTSLIITGSTILMGCAAASVGENPTLEPDTRITCRGTVYDGYTYRGAIAIPDDDPAGTRIGPIQIADDGQRLGELMVGVDISHGYVGDVQIRLLYDVNADGDADVHAELELHQSRVDPCDREALHAYPVVLDGEYYFRGHVDEVSSNEVSPLTSFNDLPKGGDFYLDVADSAAHHAGTIRSWSVYLGTHGTSTRTTMTDTRSGLAVAVEP